jgi:hypothetical protein
MIQTTFSSSSANVIPFPVRYYRPLDDLFANPTSTAPSTGIVGLAVKMLHRPCRTCGCTDFIIGSSAAMHCARLTCAGCDAFGGWMSQGAFTFTRMTIEKFGRPTEPIIVRHSEP